MHSRFSAAIVVAVVAGLTGSYAGDASALTLTNSKLVHKTFAPNAHRLALGQNGYAGGRVVCPRGLSKSARRMKVVTGGAFWSFSHPADPSNMRLQDALHARVSSSAPTPDASAWYADGVSDTGALDLTVFALCVPPGQVQNYSLTPKEFGPDRYGITGQHPEPCPLGNRAVGAGPTWSKPSGLPQPHPSFAMDGQSSSSAPLLDGSGWVANGRILEGPPPNLVMFLMLQCLPQAELAGATVQTASYVPNGEGLAGGTVYCPTVGSLIHPRIMQAFSGGAYWHEPGAGPDSTISWSAFVSNSGMLRSDHGWYANGWRYVDTGPEALVLTVVVQCI